MTDMVGRGAKGSANARPAGGEPLRGVVPGPEFARLPGIERLRAWAEGTQPLPPLCHLTGMRVTQVEPAAITVTLPASPWLVNGVGVLIAVDLLSAVGCELAGLTVVGAGTRARLVALNSQAMRMARLGDGPFSTRGTVIHAGRTLIRVTVVIQDVKGRVVGHAIGSLAVQPDDTLPAARVTRTSAGRYDGPDPFERAIDDELNMRVWDQRVPIEVFRAVSSGELPPPNFNRLFGLRLNDITEGTSTLSLEASPWFALQDGAVAPAVLNVVAAFSSGAAAMSLGSPARIGGELNRALAFERPIPADGREVVVRGTTRVQSANIIVCEVEVSDPDGNIAMLEQALWLLVPRRDEGAVAPAPRRLVATVMFTDIVASTERAAALGDAKWQETLAEHHQLVRQQLQIFRGQEVKTTGDGFLATFDSPARAVQCARAIRDRIQATGLQIRAALHAGELDLADDDISGIAVHIASRILSACASGEILVSSTIRDLTTGSGLRLEDRGSHSLKGLGDEWCLFAVRD